MRTILIIVYNDNVDERDTQFFLNLIQYKTTTKKLHKG